MIQSDKNIREILDWVWIEWISGLGGWGWSCPQYRLNCLVENIHIIQHSKYYLWISKRKIKTQYAETVDIYYIWVLCDKSSFNFFFWLRFFKLQKSTNLLYFKLKHHKNSLSSLICISIFIPHHQYPRELHFY